MAPDSVPIDVDRFVRSTGITYDETYHLLANEHTRAAIHVLSEDTETTLDRLARTVARRVTDGIDAVRLSLVHVVLPKLESYGLLTYDRRESRVTVERNEVRASGTLEDVVISAGSS